MKLSFSSESTSHVDPRSDDTNVPKLLTLSLPRCDFIDFTPSNTRRFYSSKGDPLGVKGLNQETPDKIRRVPIKLGGLEISLQQSIFCPAIAPLDMGVLVGNFEKML